MRGKDELCLSLNLKEVQKLQSILKWVQISTRQSKEERLAVEKILFKLRRLDRRFDVE